MSDASFGDVTAEYLALRRGCGLVRGLHEAVLVAGSDAISFLQGLLSQDLNQPPGSVVRSFLLSPQGKLRALLWVLVGEDEAVLVCDSGSAETVVADLTRYRIRVDVELRPEDRSIVELWGPAAAEVLGAAGVSVDGGWSQTATWWSARVPLDGLDRFLVAGIDAAQLVATGAVQSGDLAVRAVRVEAGEPVMGVDVDESTIPQETGLVPDSVSFTKGCYLGQELVARIDSRGRVNRHLRGLVVRENVLPPVGAEAWAGDRSVGVLGSVAESLTLRAPIALALLRREVEPGDVLAITWDGGEVAAVARELPLDDFTDR